MVKIDLDALRDWAKINAAFSTERDALDAAIDDEGIVFSISEETGAADGVSQPAESVAVIFAQSLKRWFLSYSRDLPWRLERTPYAVWISEVMLQQTQAAVVIPYFLKWMERFPTIERLAAASLDDVLKQWEGLGYYSRARYLHEGARYIMDHFGGKLPQSVDHLKQIKGLGPYTIGAILSFAFHQRKAAVDGNVLRVLARYFALDDDISKAKSVKKIQQMAEGLLPVEEPWIITEALIELGATVCMKKPLCGECPLQNGCRAFKEGLTSQLPVKGGNKPVTILYRGVAVVRHEEYLLTRRGAKGKVMEGLCEFPYFELDQLSCTPDWIMEKVLSSFDLATTWQKSLSSLSHSFTRYRAHLLPHLLHAEQRNKVEGFDWVELELLKQHPFSAGHRGIFAELLAFSTFPQRNAKKSYVSAMECGKVKFETLNGPNKIV